MKKSARIHRIIKIVLSLLLLIILGFLVVIEGIKYDISRSIPDDAVITVIEDTQIEGILKLYFDEHHSRYWLFYIKDDSEKMVVFGSGIRGEVHVTVIGNETIEVFYDYKAYGPRAFQEDKAITLDLSKNETINVPLIRKFQEFF